MIARLAQLANDCYHVVRGPGPAKASVLKNLLLPGHRKMGFRVEHFERGATSSLFREIFVRQYYHFVAQTASPTILDCGANVGMASIYFKWLYPKSKVQAFEPDPMTFNMLQRNLRVNRLDVKTHNCALWNENGELDFHVDASHPGSVLMSAASPMYLEKADVVKVPARKLSDFINGPVDFLKLDVEGAEHRVLDDLVQTGTIKQVRQMVVEYHHRYGQQKSRLANFLMKLEVSGFEYQIHASRFPIATQGVLQAMIISANQ